MEVESESQWPPCWQGRARRSSSRRMGRLVITSDSAGFRTGTFVNILGYLIEALVTIQLVQLFLVRCKSTCIRAKMRKIEEGL